MCENWSSIVQIGGIGEMRYERGETIERVKRAWDMLEEYPIELLPGEGSVVKCPNCGRNVLTQVRLGGLKRIEWKCLFCGWKSFRVI